MNLNLVPVKKLLSRFVRFAEFSAEYWSPTAIHQECLIWARLQTVMEGKRADARELVLESRLVTVLLSRYSVVLLT